MCLLVANSPSIVKDVFMVRAFFMNSEDKSDI